MSTNEKVKNQLASRKASAPVTPEQTVEAYMKKWPRVLRKYYQNT